MGAIVAVTVLVYETRFFRQPVKGQNTGVADDR
jgi:hypothetical protein